MALIRLQHLPKCVSLQMIRSNDVSLMWIKLKIASNSIIVLFKMFLRWFFANNKTNVTSTALKLCSVTEDVMS